MSGKKPEELHQPDMPEGFTHILHWLAEIPTVSWAEIHAWKQVTGRQPQRWELDLLLELDRMRRT